MNATNDNLWQYVGAYSELVLEIRHMHELDRVCQFVMGLPTWAKRKLEENWPSSLSEAIMKVEGFSDVRRGKKSRFKKDNKFLHKKPRHLAPTSDWEWNRMQRSPTKDKPKQFQGLGFKPKGNFVKKRAPFKGSQRRFWGETQRSMLQLQRSEALFQKLSQVQNGELTRPQVLCLTQNGSK